MPTKSEKTSSAEGGRQGPDSVYDFLYHDARRVGSFLAQLDPGGLLQGYKTSGQVRNSSSKTSGVDARIGIPRVAHFGGKAEDLAGEETVESSDKTYDPLWTNALALLTHLKARNLYVRDVHSANIGQFVLIKGFIKVLNLKAIERLWGTDALKAQLAHNTAGQTQKEKFDNAVGIEVVAGLPHAIQGFVYKPEDEHGIVSGSWMILEDESMVVSPSSIMMKYGTWVGADWNVLAIKDAFIDDGPQIDTELAELMNEGWETAAAARNSSPFALLTEMLSPLARQLMGRPGALYGLTPLLIFREVGQPIGAEV